MDKRNDKELLEEERKKKIDEEHKYEIYKLLQDSKNQLPKRKTLRQTSKVNLPMNVTMITNHNKKIPLSKRNSMNDQVISGLSSANSSSITSSAIVFGAYENKVNGLSTSATAAKKASSHS